jgi:apolipoprotein N-acyltransferase
MRRGWAVRRIGVGCLLWVLLYGFPQSAPPPPERPLTVRLVQAMSEDEESFFSLALPAPGEPRPDIVVLPEYSFVTDPMRQPKLLAKLRNVAQTNGSYLLFGAKDEQNARDDTTFRNTAYLFAPDGSEAGRHVKIHLVHFLKDGISGTTARALSTPLGRLGVSICFDNDYPDVARRLAADGAEVFLVPNAEPLEWGDVEPTQHRLLFQMRAAENGRWLARADVAGGTSVVAPNGQTTAHVTTREPTVLTAQVGRSRAVTLYTRGGWRFGPFCLMGCFVLWALSWRIPQHDSPTGRTASAV